LGGNKVVNTLAEYVYYFNPKKNSQETSFWFLYVSDKLLSKMVCDPLSPSLYECYLDLYNLLLRIVASPPKFEQEKRGVHFLLSEVKTSVNV